MKIHPMGAKLFHVDRHRCMVRHAEGNSGFSYFANVPKNCPIRGIFVMPVSYAVVCHTLNTVVFLCDNTNIYEACLEAFATQFIIGSNLLCSYLN